MKFCYMYIVDDILAPIYTSYIQCIKTRLVTRDRITPQKIRERGKHREKVIDGVGQRSKLELRGILLFDRSIDYTLPIKDT